MPGVLWAAKKPDTTSLHRGTTSPCVSHKRARTPERSGVLVRVCKAYCWCLYSMRLLTVCLDWASSL